MSTDLRRVPVGSTPPKKKIGGRPTILGSIVAREDSPQPLRNSPTTVPRSPGRIPLPALEANGDRRIVVNGETCIERRVVPGSAPWLISEAKLAERVRGQKNMSPFDARKFHPMLPPPRPEHKKKILLCVDLDETLVHASVMDSTNDSPGSPSPKADLVIPIHDGGVLQGHVVVAFRPHVKEFLAVIADLFEVALFTASQGVYASPVVNELEAGKAIFTHRMFREHCSEVGGTRVKDMSLLGRPLERIALLDNSPVTYLFQPRNAIPVESWFSDPNDDELMKLVPLLTALANEASVYGLLDQFNSKVVHANIG